jgi:short-subunit dehydrogenase
VYKERESKKYSVVLGGSSGVGRALVELLAVGGSKVLAVASDIRDLEALQNDIQLRHGARIEVVAADLASVDFEPEAFTKDCIKTLGKITHIFMTVGAISNEDKGVPSAKIVEKLAMINFIRPAQLLGTFSQHFEETGFGNAMIFSSIATAAPRRNNSSYTAAKAGLEMYCRSLQHHFGNSSIYIKVCALGYVDTNMSYGKKLLLPAVSPHAVARFSLHMCLTDKHFAYYPSFWWLITNMLRLIPWYFYKKLTF